MEDFIEALKWMGYFYFTVEAIKFLSIFFAKPVKKQ